MSHNINIGSLTHDGAITAAAHKTANKTITQLQIYAAIATKDELERAKGDPESGECATFNGQYKK